MKTNHLIFLLIIGLMITSTKLAIAKPDGIMRQKANSGFSPLAQIDLSTEQTKKIRELRLAHEESIAPLRIEEHQLQAELDIFWLQLTPDIEKIRAAQKKIHDIKFQILEQETDFRIAIRSILTQGQLSRFLALGGNRRQGPDKFDPRPPRPPQPERY